MALTKATVAELVQRSIQVPVLGADKKTPVRDKVTKMPLFKEKLVEVGEKEVLDFSLNGDALTVVTVDGAKLKATLTDAQIKSFTPADPDKV